MKRFVPNEDADVYASTQFSIKTRCSFSHVFLMTVKKGDMLFFTLMTCTPLALAILFAYQLYISLTRDMKERPSVYVPNADVYYIEYTIIVIVCVARLLPRVLDLMRVLADVQLFFSMWKNSKSYGGRFLAAGFTRIFLKLFVVPVIALAMGVFSALFNSGSVLRVVFNILLFGFLLDLDDALVKEYIKLRYSTSYVQVALTNVRFRDGKEAFWANSESSEDTILELLKEADPVNMTAGHCFALLTSARNGLGISRMGGTTCKLRISVLQMSDASSRASKKCC